MDIRKYESYDTAAMLADVDFQRWALRPGAEEEALWEAVFAVYPEKRILAMNAKATLQQLQFKTTVFPEHRKTVRREALEQLLEEEATPVITLRRRSYRWLYQVAAVLLVMLLVAGWWRLQQATPVRAKFFTKNGEIKTLTLPDSTIVVLNANSSLEYPTDWNNSQDREVWMKGEGYFTVAHQYNTRQQRTKFTVHTNDLDVLVWGTTFNVNTRRGITRVSLNSGKISIGFPDARKAPVMMQPGDMIEYTSRQRKLQASRVNPAEYSSWQHRELVFNNMSLREMGNKIEDIYGYKVRIADSTTANRTISGRLLAKSDTMLLQTIAAVFNLDISMKDSVVVVAPR
ncbi:FecR family protein [Chitinophaga nivalis]|uniref:FecR domain-containing protein n=1 Tax=Chitinophaga nivalis TaxID=2991709 RepID=A0ABT3IP07_9BACT|nr:FecR domain-containing protein [Chitinophaga nivalis]MCW3464609.1 FecR domain-containing protein [Chitinophaga nivalis]MCW3485700.1 FecR domain-containing protein [Chitinophaga nivalis]